MTKSELIEELAVELKCSNGTASSIVSTILGAMTETALTPNIRTTLLSGICIPKLVLKEDANERKKKSTFGQI